MPCQGPCSWTDTRCANIRSRHFDKISESCHKQPSYSAKQFVKTSHLEKKMPPTKRFGLLPRPLTSPVILRAFQKAIVRWSESEGSHCLADRNNAPLSRERSCAIPAF